LDRGCLGVDLAGPRVWQQGHADADSGQESGVGGTPTLFINGRRHLAGDDQATLARAGHRNHEAMTMAVCLHLNQRTLAFVSATLGD
jgi:hypothetical protein